jgi:hypothetical protein
VLTGLAFFATRDRQPAAAADFADQGQPFFPDFKDPNRIQMIAIVFSVDPDPKNVERRAWQQRVKDTFDYAALAALLK